MQDLFVKADLDDSYEKGIFSAEWDLFGTRRAQSLSLFWKTIVEMYFIRKEQLLLAEV